MRRLLRRILNVITIVLLAIIVIVAGLMIRGHWGTDYVCIPLGEHSWQFASGRGRMVFAVTHSRGPHRREFAVARGAIDGEPIGGGVRLQADMTRGDLRTIYNPDDPHGTPLGRVWTDARFRTYRDDQTLAIATALLPVALLLRWLVRPAALSPDVCRKCGYDCRATPDRCPECGNVLAALPPNAPPRSPADRSPPLD
jgi:hypothetical protein